MLIEITDRNICKLFLFYRLLGELLEITDYATNMASFWFLDTLALYMLRYKDELDEYYMAVLISWLTGEMKLLRGNEIIKRSSLFYFIYIYIFLLFLQLLSYL